MPQVLAALGRVDELFEQDHVVLAERQRLARARDQRDHVGDVPALDDRGRVAERERQHAVVAGARRIEDHVAGLRVVAERRRHGHVDVVGAGVDAAVAVLRGELLVALVRRVAREAERVAPAHLVLARPRDREPRVVGDAGEPALGRRGLDGGELDGVEPPDPQSRRCAVDRMISFARCTSLTPGSCTRI